MKTYLIHCTPRDRGPILEILRRDHDIIINKADESSISVTLEKDNPEADLHYEMLLERINRELHLAVQLAHF